MITIEPVRSDLGAVVSGALEDSSPRAEIAAMLRQALLKHHLLIVRARVLAPPEQIDFASMFGEPQPFDAPMIPEHPLIYRISNQPGQGHLNVGRYWHVDGTNKVAGTPISVWHVIQHPEEGGDTLFTSMHRAYEEMPDDLRVIVDRTFMIGFTGVKQPLVKRHPATGRKMLYASIGMTKRFEGMDEEQSKALLARLSEHLDRPGAHYRHKWLVGDVLVGDNHAVAHKATPTDPKYPRTLHRVTIAGGTAFYRPQAAGAAQARSDA